jgi:hypothetical protein
MFNESSTLDTLHVFSLYTLAFILKGECTLVWSSGIN